VVALERLLHQSLRIIGFSFLPLKRMKGPALIKQSLDIFKGLLKLSLN
jgi:hypothetical protein